MADNSNQKQDIKKKRIQASKSKLNLIAIGASAGGLDALQVFLTHLPAEMENTCILIAQHVSPTHKSMLVDLLSRKTEWTVTEAKNGIEPKEGCIYITPPDKEIIWKNGEIRLSKPPKRVGPKPSVDTLFKSLSEYNSGNVIGMILSGTGTDGAAGTRSLKEAGAFIIAQEPHTAKYDGMPLAAIQTGSVDKVLPPEKIGEVILEYLKNPGQIRYRENFDKEKGGSKEEVFRLLSTRTGTDFSNYKSTTIGRRFLKRLSMLQIESVEEYLEYIEGKPDELDEIFRIILIGVTQFFRDPEAFKALEQNLREIVKFKTNRDPIRIWVPGCSTGEEAYSIAILLCEILKNKIQNYNIQIFATDIDQQAVSFARKGVYQAESLEEVPEKIINEYFLKNDNKYELIKQVRSMVLFSRHDITNNPPFLKLDLISCRNLLIYFNTNLQQQVIPIFHYTLNPNSILFLGKSETVGQFSEHFSTIDGKNKLFRRKKGGNLNTVKLPVFRSQKQIAMNEPKMVKKKDFTISDLVKETLFNTYEHPYVVIDENYNIRETHGDVRPFMTLPSGSIHVNLLKMINQELQLEARSVISKAIRNRESAKSDIRRFELYNKKYFVKISVKPLIYSETTDELFLVIFELLDINKYPVTSSKTNRMNATNERILELEHELAATKEHLQTYIEEIETSNEELQSLNEELQSTNDELLERDKEQACLYNISRLHESDHTIEELIAKSINYIQHGLQFPDLTEVRIRFDGKIYQSGKYSHRKKRITAVSERIENKPLSIDVVYLKSRKNPDFLKNEQELIETIARLLSLKIYQKLTRQQLEESRNSLQKILSQSMDIICTIDADGKFVSVSDAASRIWGYQPKELEGKDYLNFVYSGDRQKSESADERILSGSTFTNFENRYVTKSGDIVSMIWSARWDSNDELMYCVARDATEIKEAEDELRLYESIVTNTKDAVIITNTDHGLENEDPEIIYVNKAFTTMTDYSAEEAVGKTLQLLQGDKTITTAYESFKKQLMDGNPCETELIHYKKTGDEFWASVSASPVFNSEGEQTQWIFIQRDITERKIRESYNKLVADISRVFNENSGVQKSLQAVMTEIIPFAEFNSAEVWLVNSDKKSIIRSAQYTGSEMMQEFYEKTADVHTFEKGMGFPGAVWESGEVQNWTSDNSQKSFRRNQAADEAGLKSAYGIPLTHNHEIQGVLILGQLKQTKMEPYLIPFFEQLSEQLGVEIYRKKLEEELESIFRYAPDIVCIAGTDGYFKKLNPAAIDLLGYSYEELLSRPYRNFVHPEDQLATDIQTKEIGEGGTTYIFENRYITKSGKVKWLSWTAAPFDNKKQMVALAKDITEQKELEQLLRQVNRLARIGSWELTLANGETDKIFWSEMTREILEVDEEYNPTLTGGFEFYESESKKQIQKAVEKAISEGQPFDLELNLVTARGNKTWVRCIGQTEMVGDECVRLFGSFQDIHKRKEAEIAYQNASSERDAILESISDAFYAIDQDWNFRYFNREAERQLNQTSEEVLGRNVWEVFPEAKVTELYNYYSDVMDQNEPSSFEYYYPPLETWFDISIYPAGHGISVYFKNINERKKARLVLEEANREKESILESIGDGFFTVEEDWSVSYWNNKAEDILGKKKEDILGENLWEHYKEAMPLKFYTEYHKAMAEKVSVHFEEYFPPLEKWFEVSAYPADSGLSVYFVDATERKRSERKLKELNKSLEEQANELAKSNAELEQFAFVASHDLQEPLRMVTSFLTQLKRKYDGQLDEEAQKYIHFATDGAERMRHIILDLLEYSRVGSVEIDKKDVDLNEVLNEVLAYQKKTIEEKNAVINFPDLPVIRASEVHMKQLLQNLISNGLKYQSDGNQPVIDIFVQEKDDSWLFGVSDNGIGIESKYHEKIFAIFQRLHAKGEYSGTGIGLTICKKIVEQHNGEIWVEPGIEQGTTFYFTISKLR